MANHSVPYIDDDKWRFLNKQFLMYKGKVDCDLIRNKQTMIPRDEANDQFLGAFIPHTHKWRKLWPRFLGAFLTHISDESYDHDFLEHSSRTSATKATTKISWSIPHAHQRRKLRPRFLGAFFTHISDERYILTSFTKKEQQNCNHLEEGRHHTKINI